MDGKVRPKQKKNFTKECFREAKLSLSVSTPLKIIVNDENLNLTKRIANNGKVEKTNTTLLNGDTKCEILEKLNVVKCHML